MSFPVKHPVDSYPRHKPNIHNIYLVIWCLSDIHRLPNPVYILTGLELIPFHLAATTTRITHPPELVPVIDTVNNPWTLNLHPAVGGFCGCSMGES